MSSYKNMVKNTDSSETLVTMLLSGQLVNHSLISGKSKRFSLLQTVRNGSGAMLEMCIMGIFLGEWSGQGKRLTNHLHLVSMIRMHEATPSLIHTPS
jgi:hypothetical protein